MKYTVHCYGVIILFTIIINCFNLVGVINCLSVFMIVFFLWGQVIQFTQGTNPNLVKERLWILKMKKRIETIPLIISLPLFILLIAIIANPTESRFSKVLENRYNDIYDNISSKNGIRYYDGEELPDNLRPSEFYRCEKVSNRIVFSTFESTVLNNKNESILRSEKYIGFLGIFIKVDEDEKTQERTMANSSL